MGGTDNHDVCPPIVGCYTHWTFWGYLRLPARLSSMHCLLYVTFCSSIWGAKLCFCHDSSQVFAPFDSFLFFFSRVCPQDSTPQGAPTDINVYGGDPYMEIEGGTTCGFGAHIVG